MDSNDTTAEKVIAFPVTKEAKIVSTLKEESTSNSIIEDPCPFCEEGTLLAMNLMRTVGKGVEWVDAFTPDRIRRSVNASLEDFLEHRAECKLCKPDFE